MDKSTKNAFALKAGLLQIYFVLAVVLCTFSCNNKASDTSTSDTVPLKGAQSDTAHSNTPAAALLTSDELHTLYIENNKSSQQLDMLLPNKNAHKVVLQFRIDDEGYLGLLAFAYKPGNRDIEPDQVIVLKRSDEVPMSLPDHTAVTLGDMQLTNKMPTTNTLKQLQDNVFKSSMPAEIDGWQYIWFTPERKTLTEGAFSKTYIVYKVEAKSYAPGATAPLQAPPPTPLGYINPSPPAQIE